MSVPAAAKCISCGADCDPRNATCWLCYSAQSEADGVNAYAVGLQSGVDDGHDGSTLIVDAPYSAVDYCFLILLIGCILLTVLIGIGIMADEPSAIIGFVVLVAPAFIITTLRTLSRTGRTGVKPRPGQMLATLLLSFAGTIGVILLLGLAAAVLLLTVCFGAVATGSP